MAPGRSHSMAIHANYLETPQLPADLLTAIMQTFLPYIEGKRHEEVLQDFEELLIFYDQSTLCLAGKYITLRLSQSDQASSRCPHHQA